MIGNQSVGTPLCNQPKHFQFSHCQGMEWVLASTYAEECKLGGQFLADITSARSHRLKGL